MADSHDVLKDTNGVAQALGVSPQSVRRWVCKGELPVVRLGRRILFHPDDIDSFIEERRGRIGGKEAA